MECGGKRSATPLWLLFVRYKTSLCHGVRRQAQRDAAWLVFVRYKTSLCHGVRRQAQRDAALAFVCAVQNQPLPWSAAASAARRRFGLCLCRIHLKTRLSSQSGVALRLPPHSMDYQFGQKKARQTCRVRQQSRRVPSELWVTVEIADQEICRTPSLLVEHPQRKAFLCY